MTSYSKQFVQECAECFHLRSSILQEHDNDGSVDSHFEINPSWQIRQVFSWSFDTIHNRLNTTYTCIVCSDQTAKPSSRTQHRRNKILRSTRHYLNIQLINHQHLFTLHMMEQNLLLKSRASVLHEWSLHKYLVLFWKII